MCCTFKALSFFHDVIQFPTVDNPQSFIIKMTANFLFRSRWLYTQCMYMYRNIKWLLNKFLYYILKLKNIITPENLLNQNEKLIFKRNLIFWVFCLFVCLVGFFFGKSLVTFFMMNPYHTCTSTFLYITIDWGELNMESTMPHAMI